LDLLRLADLVAHRQDGLVEPPIELAQDQIANDKEPASATHHVQYYELHFVHRILRVRRNPGHVKGLGGAMERGGAL